MEIDLHAIKSVIQGRLSSYVLGAILPKLKVRHRRRRRGGELGKSIYPSPKPTIRTLGSVMSSPSKVRGGASAKKRIRCILSVTEPFWLQDIVKIMKNAK